MNHRLIHAIEKALNWSGARALGEQFARGTMPDTDLCARLLTPTKLLDLVMRRSLTSPQLRCFQNETELHPAGYLADNVNRRGQSIRMADMRRLGYLLQQGCTLVLDTVDSFDPTMEVACRALQWWSREVVQVNTYLTTQDASGFSLHWDDHDVLIVQLAGEKSWEVRSFSRPVPMYRDAAPNPEPSDEIVWSGTLRTGDVMHIPRGYWHQATRVGHDAGFSLHVTFGFVKRTGVDWLKWLADGCREDELFRHDLNRWGTQEQRAAQAKDLAATASRLLPARSPWEFLAQREQERPAHPRVATFGIFGKPALVVCVTSFPPQVEQHGETVDILAAGKRLTFKAKAVPALRLLLSGNPVSIAEATLTTGANVERLADVLLTEEICAELTPELSSGYTGLAMNGDSSKEH